jgi:hypothetical protein
LYKTIIKHSNNVISFLLEGISEDLMGISVKFGDFGNSRYPIIAAMLWSNLLLKQNYGHVPVRRAATGINSRGVAQNDSSFLTKKTEESPYVDFPEEVYQDGIGLFPR